jgi:hypothetical protein
MKQTLIQKLIAKAAGKVEVQQGEIVFVTPHRIRQTGYSLLLIMQFHRQMNVKH